MEISQKKRKKIFVTGVSSLLMSQLLPSFPAEEFEIVGLSRKSHESEKLRYTLALGELQRPDNWKHYLQGVDIIIHAAALTHSFDEKKYFEVNYIGTKILIDLANAYNVPNFVFISSRTACKDSGGYGLSKLYAEQYLASSFTNYLIIKPSEIFGGSKNEGIEKLILDTIQKKFVACPIQISSKMFPIHIDDTVSIIGKIILEGNFKKKSITINGPTPYDILDIIKLTKNIAGSNPLVIPIPKLVMFLIKNILKSFKINVGINPDQIDRLYCEKDFLIMERPYVSLESYIRKIAKSVVVSSLEK